MATLVIAGQEFNFNEGLGMANMIDMIRAIALLAKQNPSASITVKDDGVAVGGSLSSLDFKGSGARIHVGVIAQDVKSAFEAEGLVAENYSILCYDEWVAELDENGNVVKPAGNRYGVRYEELLAFIISAM